MRYWLIRTDAPTVDFSLGEKRFFLTSRRTPRIKRNDVVLLLVDGIESGRFAYTGKVIGVSGGVNEAEEGLRRTEIAVEKWNELPSEATIDDLRYSLTFLRNLRRPYLHFRRGYRLLPPADFDTVSRGSPFLARSSYFELLTALPLPLRQAFLAEELQQAESFDSSVEFVARLTHLVAFIRLRVLSAGEILQDIATIIRGEELGSDEDSNVVHLLAEEEEDGTVDLRRRDDLLVQAALFAQLRESLDLSTAAPATGQDREAVDPQVDVFSNILTAIRRQDIRSSEMRFEVLFRGNREFI